MSDVIRIFFFVVVDINARDRVYIKCSDVADPRMIAEAVATSVTSSVAHVTGKHLKARQSSVAMPCIDEGPQLELLQKPVWSRCPLQYANIYTHAAIQSVEELRWVGA